MLRAIKSFPTYGDSMNYLQNALSEQPHSGLANRGLWLPISYCLTPIKLEMLSHEAAATPPSQKQHWLSYNRNLTCSVKHRKVKMGPQISFPACHRSHILKPGTIIAKTQYLHSWFSHVHTINMTSVKIVPEHTPPFKNAYLLPVIKTSLSGRTVF
uniref:Uncharacterized protein n=1 Tax=Sphaerodactylus townsendi TaxID=933632 RepID=A0ACB8G937_9SAUR